MKYITIPLIFISIILSGCKGQNLALSEACDELTEMCEKLKPDGRCLSLRRDVIIGTLNLRENFTQRNQYHHMLILEDYIDCAEKATWISYKDLKSEYKIKDIQNNVRPDERIILKRKKRIDGQQKIKNDRITSYGYAKNLLNKLSDESINNKDEYSLYWHWTRNVDKKAIKSLVKLDKIGKINTYDMKYYLAQEYIKRDPDKAIKYMLSSLSMYPKNYYTPRLKNDKIEDHEILREKGKIHYSLLRSLSTLYFNKKDYKKSYVFARILIINNENTVNPEMIIPHLKNNNIKLLNKIAENIHESLEDGAFSI